MRASPLVTLVVAAGVLLAAAYAAREDAALGLAVAAVGLPATHYGGVLGLPTGVGAAAAAVHAPGLAALLVVLALVAVPLFALLAIVARYGAAEGTGLGGGPVGTTWGAGDSWGGGDCGGGGDGGGCF
jgi:hypothetical protein